MGLKSNSQRSGRGNSQGLKSDHYGIEIQVSLGITGSSKVLKSDHYGIEMHIHSVGILTKKELKSDQYGIEIFQIEIVKKLGFQVKIRPVWD